MLLCKLAAPLTLYDLVRLVTFVSHEYFGHVGSGMLINLLQPILDVIESLLVSAVVHQNDAHRPLVVSLSDSPESLLSCCVPHLQLNLLIVHVDLLYFEVNTY
jgi:hypothetical protein